MRGVRAVQNREGEKGLRWEPEGVRGPGPGALSARLSAQQVCPGVARSSGALLALASPPLASSGAEGHGCVCSLVTRGFSGLGRSAVRCGGKTVFPEPRVLQETLEVSHFE